VGSIQWFGFRVVLKGTDENGFQKLRDMPNNTPVSPHKVIGDVEALLIKSMALANRANMKFVHAEKWEQIKLDEIVKFTGRLDV
jgi:hypothetical protein